MDNYTTKNDKKEEPNKKQPFEPLKSVKIDDSKPKRIIKNTK